MHFSRNGRERGFFQLLSAPLLALACGTPVVALAQVGELSQPRQVALASLDQLLATSVTVASRTQQTFIEAPSSVTLFTRREMLNLGVRTVEELLRFVPGLQSVQPASRSHYAVGVRGRNSAYMSNDILILVNGRRLNDAYSGAALLFNRYLSTGNVRQVEVVRGPGSALYGSNAFLAVVNIVTADDLNQAFVAGGSPDSGEAQLNLSGDAGPYRGSLFIGGLKDGGDQLDNVGAPPGATFRDPRQTLSVQAGLSGERFELTARYHAWREDESMMFRTAPARPDNYVDTGDFNLDFSYRLVDDESAGLTLSTGYRQIHQDALTEFVPAGQMQALQAMGLTTGTEALVGGAVLDQREYHLDLDGHYQLNARHKLFGGLAYRYADIDAVRNQNNYETVDFLNVVVLQQPGTIRYYGQVMETGVVTPQADRGIFGLYLQDQVRVTDSLTGTFGVRGDHYSDFGWSINPRAALVYTATDATTVKLMYGEAFRAPALLETLSGNTPVRVGNPNLEPEKVRTLELAWLQDFGRWQTTLTGFYSRIRDVIEDVPTATPGIRTFQNGGSIDLSGLEFEVNADLDRHWSLRGSATHLFDQAENPQGMSRDLASLALNYARGRYNLNLNGIYRSSAQTETVVPVDLDGYVELNTHLRVRLDEITLVGGIDNLLDRDYQTLSRLNVPAGSPNRGRTWRLGAEIDF